MDCLAVAWKGAKSAILTNRMEHIHGLVDIVGPPAFHCSTRVTPELAWSDKMNFPAHRRHSRAGENDRRRAPRWSTRRLILCQPSSTPRLAPCQPAGSFQVTLTLPTRLSTAGWPAVRVVLPWKSSARPSRPAKGAQEGWSEKVETRVSTPPWECVSIPAPPARAQAPPPPRSAAACQPSTSMRLAATGPSLAPCFPFRSRVSCLRVHDRPRVAVRLSLGA